jgi:hypothetical protein
MSIKKSTLNNFRFRFDNFLFWVNWFGQGNQDISSFGIAAGWVISATPPHTIITATVGI